MLRRLPGPRAPPTRRSRGAGRRRRTPAGGAGGLRAPDLADAPRSCVARARPGDLVLTLGAGDVTAVARRCSPCWPRVTSLRRRRHATSPADAGRAALAASASPAGSGARRWLAWRYVVVVVLVLGAARRRPLARLLLAWLAVEARRRRAARRLAVRGDDVLAGRSCQDGEPLARVDLAGIESPGRGSLAAVKDGRRLAPVAATAADRDRGTGRDRRRRDRRPAPRHGRRGRGLPRLCRAPPGLPRVQLDHRAPAEALEEAAAVIAALPRRG